MVALCFRREIRKILMMLVCNIKSTLESGSFKNHIVVKIHHHASIGNIIIGLALASFLSYGLSFFL